MSCAVADWDVLGPSKRLRDGSEFEAAPLRRCCRHGTDPFVVIDFQPSIDLDSTFHKLGSSSNHLKRKRGSALGHSGHLGHYFLDKQCSTSSPKLPPSGYDFCHDGCLVHARTGIVILGHTLGVKATSGRCRQRCEATMIKKNVDEDWLVLYCYVGEAEFVAARNCPPSTLLPFELRAMLTQTVNSRQHGRCRNELFYATSSEPGDLVGRNPSHRSGGCASSDFSFLEFCIPFAVPAELASSLEVNTAEEWIEASLGLCNVGTNIGYQDLWVVYCGHDGPDEEAYSESALREFILDVDWRVRLAVLRIIAKAAFLGDGSSIDELADFLHDEDHRVREAARTFAAEIPMVFAA